MGYSARFSGEITITIPLNPEEVNAIDEQSWLMRAQELFLGAPHRPSNNEVKYNSRHYSSASPYPMKD